MRNGKKILLILFALSAVLAAAVLAVSLSSSGHGSDGPGEGELDGYWESGYDYYVEIDGGHILIRDYAKVSVLDTSFTREAADAGKTVLTLAENGLSYDGDRVLMHVDEIYSEDGALKMSVSYTFMDRIDGFTLEKVGHDPFADLIIMDDEFLPLLEGTWIEEDGGEYPYTIEFRGNVMTMKLDGKKIAKDRIHVVRYASDDLQRVRLAPEDLTGANWFFGPFAGIEYYDGKLHTEMVVFDADSIRYTFLRLCEEM